MQQLDILFDFYRKWSRKREGRGKEHHVRLSIKENMLNCIQFSNVLKLYNNITELFNLIAYTLSGLFRNQEKSLLITLQLTVLSNRQVDLQCLQPCYKEEADDRIFPHTIEQSQL